MDDIYFPGMQTQDMQAQQSGDVYFPGMQQTSPQDVTAAQKELGSTADNGECQRFVEKAVYGKTGIFPSATDAASYYQQNGQMQTDFKNMKPGSLIYFNDPNQPDGHVGIYEGNGKMVSATYNGVQEDDVNNWLQATGQKPIGFVSIGGGQ